MRPKKSKAFIITFIIVLILLIAGYFLVVKGGILKNENSVGKKFAPLLGTPKEKDVIVGDNIDVEIPTPNTPTETGADNTDNGSSDNGSTPGSTNNGTTPGSTNTKPKYTPPDLSFPSPKTPNYTPTNSNNVNNIYQCSDGRDNDGDQLTDIEDPDCHTDGNAKNLRSYVANDNSETGTKVSTTIPVAEIDPAKKQISCGVDEIPLTFTAEEQARLDELTREFYRLAPQLKTENDIIAEITSEQHYQDTIDNAKSLTLQCRAQTSTPTYLINSIDQEIQPVGTKILFSHWEQDDGTSMSIDDSCLTRPDLCHQVFNEYTIQSTIISTWNKGRTERIRNPYYDSSKELYPFQETLSYYLQFFPDPRSSAQGRSTNKPTGVAPVVWDWNEWENWTKIW